MAWIVTLAPYAAAYLGLSIGVGLVLGRIMRGVDPIPQMSSQDALAVKGWQDADFSLS